MKITTVEVDKSEFVGVSMPRYRLGSICQIISGSTPKTGVQEYWNGDKKWITPAELSESDYIIYDTERKLTDVGVKSAGLTPLPEGTVILSSRAPIGKVAIAGCEMYCNQGFKNLVCTDVINNRYLYWYLKSKTDYLNSLGRGATFKEISKSTVSDIELNVPELSTQIERVAHLEKLQSIITGRRTQLAKLDELVKCRFVELFGDPILNEKKWITKPVKELTTKVGSGATPKGGDSSYKDSGISLIRSLNVHNNIFKTKELAHIDNEQANQLSNVTIQSGDVLLNITGASVARCCIVPDDILPARVNQHVCIIRCNDMLNPLFLERLLTSDNYQTYLWNVAEGGGGTRQALTKQQIENFSIITPPITLQATFATFVSRIDKLRIGVQAALEKAQTLFDSLMQEYFG